MDAAVSYVGSGAGLERHGSLVSTLAWHLSGSLKHLVEHAQYPPIGCTQLLQRARSRKLERVEPLPRCFADAAAA